MLEKDLGYHIALFLAIFCNICANIIRFVSRNFMT